MKIQRARKRRRCEVCDAVIYTHERYAVLNRALSDGAQAKVAICLRCTAKPPSAD